ncbi:MAC/perforin domain-containing protein [Cystobacter ferrugineus]|uniref:MACPF-like domain-containing protein n=1 Tax=Cystobacter ferrugineus TaxID=83449 RepID=A0A1L9BFF3_9BACT|nr:MAC/perforin domain-containing protein [Cystobacter ferrugineus]OJH41004.1 hypothetical protein BON30_08840 [Cystobacter ferrugineus]
MTVNLIKVDRSDGESRSFALDPNAKLDATRNALTSPPNSFMSEQDAFLNDNSPIDRSAERLIPLTSLVQGTNTLRIGQAGDIGGDDGVDRYNRLSEADKRALFENIQIRRGLTVDAAGFKKTFKDLYDWRQGLLPTANMPRALTLLAQSYTFTERTHSLETSGVQSGSVSITTPWGGSEANYQYAQQHSSSSQKISQYITQRYLSNKVDLDIKVRDLQVTPAFLKAVQDAVKDKQGNINGYQDLVLVLNEWGWYVPLQYTLGGALYATKRTEISKYSEAEKKSQSFGGSFKAAFNGIGGGAAYENAVGSHSSESGSDEDSNMVILQIGGTAGTNNDYKAWNDSLARAISWNVVTFQKLIPSLMLLVGVDNNTLTTCTALLQKFNSYEHVSALQNVIDVAGYERELARLLNPFG